MTQLSETVNITVLGHPYVKKSGQRLALWGGRMRRVDTPNYHAWHNKAVSQIIRQKARMEKPDGYFQPIRKAVNLQCRFFMPTRHRVDLSALYEGIQDVLVECGILYDDNFNIVASHDGSGVAIDRENPRIEVTITVKE